MKVLVVGASGMLGSAVVKVLRDRNHDALAPSSAELNITDPESVATVAQMKDVDWCINCAAYTAVDK
ncbi:MAG: sugar nucleotide-binding protein, partial [Chlorobia bacterium]|nr:sugar nucleotide-binding protein [Fimbriimonadaceae bacterium]